MAFTNKAFVSFQNLILIQIFDCWKICVNYIGIKDCLFILWRLCEEEVGGCKFDIQNFFRPQGAQTIPLNQQHHNFSSYIFQKSNLTTCFFMLGDTCYSVRYKIFQVAHILKSLLPSKRHLPSFHHMDI